MANSDDKKRQLFKIKHPEGRKAFSKQKRKERLEKKEAKRKLKLEHETRT